MYGYGNSGAIIWTIIIIAIVSFIVFLILREFVCWYYKINTMISLLEEQNTLFRKLLEGQNGFSNIGIKNENVKEENVSISTEKFDGATHMVIQEANFTEEEILLGGKIVRKLQKGEYVKFLREGKKELRFGEYAPFYFVESANKENGWVFSLDVKAI